MLWRMTLRLALLSDQEHPGNRAIEQRIMRMIGSAAPRFGYVSSAPDPHRTYFNASRERYAAWGADLCCYVDQLNSDCDEVIGALLTCDAIRLSGGNTFSFLGWLERSGMLDALNGYARNGGVLVGVSAGAILMTESIASAALCGDVRDSSLQSLAGLGLVSFSFWPHFDPLRLAASASLPAELTSPVYACPDGSGVVVDGTSVEVFGSVRVIA